MAPPLRPYCVLVLAGVALFAAGCGSDESIRTYKVPKPSERDAKRPAAYRILGALYPADNPVWYLKFSGSIEELTKHESDWEKFIAGVKFKSETDVPEFTLPAGWTKTGPRTKSGIKTDDVIRIGAKDPPLEVTITYISPGPQSGLKANLVRWAIQQLDGDYDPDALEALAVSFDSAGGKGLRVDLRGPKNPTAAGGPMMKPR